MALVSNQWAERFAHIQKTHAPRCLRVLEALTQGAGGPLGLGLEHEGLLRESRSGSGRGSVFPLALAALLLGRGAICQYKGRKSLRKLRFPSTQICLSSCPNDPTLSTPVSSVLGSLPSGTHCIYSLLVAQHDPRPWTYHLPDCLGEPPAATPPLGLHRDMGQGRGTWSGQGIPLL